jgi:hypothetical protein
LDQDEFLGGRIAELKTQVKHQKSTNDEVKANIILHDVIQGYKDIGDVLLKLLANIKKVLEKHMEEATDTINNNLIVC